jgi:hypothetical protein
MKYIIKILPVFIIYLFFSCDEEQFYEQSNAKLRFSADTVIFDTVFTTIGSSTQKLIVKNPYSKSLKISTIQLAGGESSSYRINIDGHSGYSLNNIELRPKDSLYIFIEVNIDPTNNNQPLVVKDSIQFYTNENYQDVKLVAWGQDVHILNSKIIETETWINDKPYLIYNYLFVDTNSTLTIEPGVKLHFHNGSRMFVAGTLIANGTFENPIVFEGDRLEDIYEDIPGQWDGIWLLPGSKDHVFEFSEIRNAIIGIQVDTLANLDKPTLFLANCKIENMTSAGLFAQGSTVEAYNTLIANCGQFAAALTIGGSYEFYHCTFANYWGYSTRKTPSILLNNYYIDIYGSTQVRNLNKALFGNCIIYGNKESEIVLDKNLSGEFNFKFDHSLIKVSADFSTNDPIFFENVIKNENPTFKDPYKYDYELDTLSIAKDAGKVEFGLRFPLDIKLDNRTTDAGPDLGAFERIETK